MTTKYLEVHNDNEIVTIDSDYRNLVLLRTQKLSWVFDDQVDGMTHAYPENRLQAINESAGEVLLAYRPLTKHLFYVHDSGISPVIDNGAEGSRRVKVGEKAEVMVYVYGAPSDKRKSEHVGLEVFDEKGRRAITSYDKPLKVKDFRERSYKTAKRLAKTTTKFDESPVEIFPGGVGFVSVYDISGEGQMLYEGQTAFSLASPVVSRRYRGDILYSEGNFNVYYADTLGLFIDVYKNGLRVRCGLAPTEPISNLDPRITDGTETAYYFVVDVTNT